MINSCWIKIRSNLFNVSNNWWLKFIEEILWKQKCFEKSKWNFRNILNLLWTGQQKCCVRTVQCNGSKQKSQLFHYTITIVTANRNWWHEKIWITSNEFFDWKYVSNRLVYSLQHPTMQKLNFEMNKKTCKSNKQLP